MVKIKHLGVKADRPGLDRALDNLREDDTLVVWRLDRLGRSLKHLIIMVEALDQKGIGFKTLQESIDTTTSSGKLIFHIFGALAEFERNLIRERTFAGLTAARARGRKGGRPKVLDLKKKELVLKLYKKRMQSVEEICNIMHISKQTLYNYVKEEKDIY
jgi:DNA invertase Pin-like site-specific DNA recombinase